MENVDYIIVGQGLAGSSLSYYLLKSGKSVKVFNTLKENSATRIAAGVFNPVTYRKLKMAEFADMLLPSVFEFYPELEKKLGVKFFSPSSFLKIITDVEELNNWQIQSENPVNKPFMSQAIYPKDFGNTIKNPNGAGQVLQSGVVNLRELVDAWKAFLIQNEAYESSPFVYENLKLEEDSVTYENVKAQKIVFCEGVGIANNPWFNWLPMQQFKGEIIEIEAPTLKLDRMVNRGVFLLPLENGKYKVGATHDWKNVDEQITEEGKKELTDKLDNIINVPYKVVRHLAGVRPATRDRHPYIGVHPIHKNLFVMNGLGSKGVIMAPWLAQTFIAGIPQLEWPKGFDITRYLRFYEEK
tara:strand:+ start:80459 stop:81523 length:1065 start_codon:yes stop_codon:yes gene_type:complete